MGNMLHHLLGEKVYHHIGHLPSSRVGPGDHTVDPGTARMFTDIVAWKGVQEHITIQEKLDGSCVSVIRNGEEIIPALRSGHRAETSPWEQHHRFAAYVSARWAAFRSLLRPNERVVGEWMAQAHGIRYGQLTDLFYVFDIRSDGVWLPALDVKRRCDQWNIETVPLLYYGPPLALEHIKRLTNRSAFRSKGCAEGAVLRREFNGRCVDIAKYVRQDHCPGIYIPGTENAVTSEPVWHVVTA